MSPQDCVYMFVYFLKLLLEDLGYSQPESSDETLTGLSTSSTIESY